jgi:hypothetical protein
VPRERSKLAARIARSGLFFRPVEDPNGAGKSSTEPEAAINSATAQPREAQATHHPTQPAQDVRPAPGWKVMPERCSGRHRRPTQRKQHQSMQVNVWTDY